MSSRRDSESSGIEYAKRVVGLQVRLTIALALLGALITLIADRIDSRLMFAIGIILMLTSPFISIPITLKVSREY